MRSLQTVCDIVHSKGRHWMGMLLTVLAGRATNVFQKVHGQGTHGLCMYVLLGSTSVAGFKISIDLSLPLQR